MNIKRYLREETNYTNTKMVVVECIGADNTLFEATLSLEEYELRMYLKNVLKDKLSQNELSKLNSLVEDFGLSKYSEGLLQ